MTAAPCPARAFPDPREVVYDLEGFSRYCQTFYRDCVGERGKGERGAGEGGADEGEVERKREAEGEGEGEIEAERERDRER